VRVVHGSPYGDLFDVLAGGEHVLVVEHTSPLPVAGVSVVVTAAGRSESSGVDARNRTASRSSRRLAGIKWGKRGNARV